MASKLNFGDVKLGRAKNAASLTCVKSRSPHAPAATYPAMIAIRIGITERKPRNRICPNTATPSVTRNTITFFGSTFSSRSPAVLAAFPASSRPISATTGPIAAVGSTISIQSVPHWRTINATHIPAIPRTTKPPRAYSYPYLLITRRAGERKAKLEPK